MDNNELSFEDALMRIETIVAKMESSDMNLEESLSLFEEGIHLIKACHKRLEHAEAKVEMIIASGESLSLEKVEFRNNGEEK